MKRILIIGGSGMLREAADYFIVNNFEVTIVGRDIKKLNYFTTKHPNAKAIELISEDYTNSLKFCKTIENSIEKKGNFDVVISWIHSYANNSLLKIIDVLAKHERNAVFYHIKGFENSAAFDVSNVKGKVDYREIILGFKVENNLPRWLTDTEISRGVISAFISNKKKLIVGQVEPKLLKP